MTDYKYRTYLFYKWYTHLPDHVKIIFKNSLDLNQGLTSLKTLDHYSIIRILIPSILSVLNTIYKTDHQSLISDSTDASFIKGLQTQSRTVRSFNFDISDIIYLLFSIKIINTELSNSLVARILNNFNELDNKELFVRFILDNFYRRGTVPTNFERILFRKINIDGFSLFNNDPRMTDLGIFNVDVKSIGVFNHE